MLKMSDTVSKEAFKIGGTTLALSVGITALGYYAIATEQAGSPGEQNFGVGILALMFGAPVLILKVTRLVSVLVGVFLALRMR